MHRRLLLLTRDTRLPLLLTILAGLLTGLLTIGQSYALSSTVSAVFLQRAGLAQVWPWMQLLLGIAAARAVLVWVNELAANNVAVRIKIDLREKLFSHILALGPAYTHGERTGELTTAAIEGIEALDAYFSQYLPQLVISALVPTAILILVFPLDPLSGIVLLLTAPLIPFFMYMIGRGAEAVTKKQYETLSRLSAHFLDSLQGLTTLKLFGQSKAQARNIGRVNDEYRDTTLKVLQVTFLSAFALELLATLSTAIIAVEVGLRLLYDQMQFQQALFLLILAPEFYLPLRMLGLRFHAGMAGSSAARRIFQILDTPIREQIHSKESDPSPKWADLTFDHLGCLDVCYTYPDEKDAAIQGVAFSIRHGEHLAMIGPSGAGKSTLANLLMRFMEPQSGKILLNGNASTDVPIEAWRALIAWVPQRPHLFHGTMGANIRLGNPAASDEAVASAAHAAHLDRFIETLPNGYETMIGEAGARLSSGQAQRLALARAFLKNAPILIMDEPTSSVDPETETMLEESTRVLMRGRTVITIAHRLNTVIHADRIIVLEAGRVVEAGSHRTLLRQGGLYARTVQAQVGVGEVTRVDGRDAPQRAVIAHFSAGQSAAELPKRSTGTLPGNSSNASVFPRLMSFLGGSWGWVALSVVLGSLTIGSSIALMGTSSWLISTAALHPSIAVLEVAIVGVRFFGIARAVFRYFERLVTHKITFQLLGRLRLWFYEKLEPLAPARLMDYRAGDLLARIIGDINILENFYVRVVAPPITATLVGIGTAIFLSYTDPRLAWLLVGTFLLLGLALPFGVQTISARWSPSLLQRRAEMHTELVDGIQGLPDLLAFGRASDRISELRRTGASYGNSQRRMAQLSGVHSGVFTLLTNMMPWLILWVTIPRVIQGDVPGVMLAPLILLTSASFEAISPLPLAAQMWTTARSAALRLFEVVDAEPAVSEPQAPETGARRGNPPSGVVEFRALSFAYPGQQSSALREISLGLQPGKKLAIVGPSGAGKTTLANLLLRFWDFDEGDICLDGRSIRSYPSDDIRAAIAVVSPSPYFFNTSVYENLRMAHRGVTREEVEWAARAAQIHDVIVKLPKGYDTLIGEQGLRLSGGERQRLAIARALLKDALIIVLDEPTANLDAVNEAGILATLFRLMDGKASMLITHRLVGLEGFDEIVVLEHGRIVERGTQAKLIELQGSFFRLWEHQNRFLVET